MAKQNNPIWVMTSAFPGRTLDEVIDRTAKVGAQGAEVCVFRQGGTRNDHIATHLDYDGFGPEQAKAVIEKFSLAGMRFSIGAYENLIGGDEASRVANQDHLLKLVRMAYLMGGNSNDVKVGTFVGYNAEVGAGMEGLQRNLELFQQVFLPIVKYAEDLGVTILYENCPMEGWRDKRSPVTYNNLPATLGARKAMYAIIPSDAHGETYDPSHDIWQMNDPSDVINHSDMRRIHRVHIKGTRNNQTSGSIHWGRTYPMQYVAEVVAGNAGIPTPGHEWDRHHYEPTLPGFGGSDSVDWRAFMQTLENRGFSGPYVIENEAALSKGTGNIGAIMQGFQATVLNLAPLIWPIMGDSGYQYPKEMYKPMSDIVPANVAVVTMKELTTNRG